MITRFKDMELDGYPISEKEANKIMHIALPIGKNSNLMASDTPELMGTHNERETRSKISISTDSKEEADHLFYGLSQGGEIEIPISASLWAPILVCLEINLVLNG